PDLVDIESFRAAAVTLHAEGYGYSRCVEDFMSGDEILDEILDQVDGVRYIDPSTGKIKVRLIRADFNPAVVRQIDQTNCVSLDNFTVSGISDMPNRIRVRYTSRADGYQDRTAMVQNLANAAGQDGVVNEMELTYPGVCTAALAEQIAAREL